MSRPALIPIATATRLVGRARDAMRRDPRRLGAAGAVGLAIVATLGRALVTGSPHPASATAAAVNADQMHARAAARPPVAAAEGSGTTRLPDAASPAMQQWVRGPIAPLDRNLFVVKLDNYPRDTDQAEQTLRAPTGNGFWDPLAKSMAARADLRRERQILVENLQLQAMQLRLQSTVTGATPSALVNGSVFREGDVVASFRVLTIEARRIVVEREGIKLEVPMQ